MPIKNKVVPFSTKKIEGLLIEILKTQEIFSMDTKSIVNKYILDMFDTKGHTYSIEIPKGDWQILGKSHQLPEEVYKKIVDVNIVDDYEIYYNYTGTMDKISAKDSFLSLMDLVGINNEMQNGSHWLILIKRKHW